VTRFAGTLAARPAQVLEESSMTQETRIVSQPIGASATAVYEFARHVENMPQWAAGLVTNVRPDGDAWFTDTPGGPIRIAMAPCNELGVLDHDVTMPDGVTTHNAMRVTPVGGASLLAFVVLRAPEATDAEFERDCGLVAQDLKTLGTLVENLARG
jgi:hypothetical protein